MAVYLLVIEDERGRTETVIRKLFDSFAEAMTDLRVREHEYPLVNGRLNILTIHEKSDE